jgi:hypothetical protein
MSHKWQRGAAKLKTVILLLVVASAIYVGAKVVPAYVANSRLQDKMWEEARFAQANRLSEEQVRDAIHREAQSLDIPIRPEDIHVEIGQRGTLINANYTVAVDLHVYQFTLNFAPTSGHP